MQRMEAGILSETRGQGPREKKDTRRIIHMAVAKQLAVSRFM